MISDGVEYSTSEYKYRKKLRVRVLILKNILEYKYRKKNSSTSTFTSLEKKIFKL